MVYWELTECWDILDLQESSNPRHIPNVYMRHYLFWIVYEFLIPGTWHSPEADRGRFNTIQYLQLKKSLISPT